MRAMPLPFLLLTFLLILVVASPSHTRFSLGKNNGNAVSKTIVVDQSGRGDFTTVQAAINSVPENNAAWIQILVRSGIYDEKVVIPPGKPYITLQGNSAADTIIQSSGVGGSDQTTTFSVHAQNFDARNIQFKNTFRPGKDGSLEIAPAAYVGADKVSFYQCSFIGLQDTLTDIVGRHYFKSCYIEGVVDFIWGGGQSVYQDCTINATVHVLPPGLSGFITAQARDSVEDKSGYVFIGGCVVGTGPVNLGRAYRRYSRVVFLWTFFSNVVQPEGWSAWNYAGQEGTITYAEMKCSGPGSDGSKRVKWMKNPLDKDLVPLTNVDTFINQDGWLKQTTISSTKKSSSPSFIMI